jgi:hypothetical protein
VPFHDGFKVILNSQVQLPGENRHKLKTPETEASGVSILMNSQYRRCCILRLPQKPTLQLSLAVASSWLRRLENPRLSSVALHSGSTGGQLSGSDRRCVAQLDRLRTSGLRRLFRASGRPAAIFFDSRRTISPPARPTINLRLASAPSFGSAGSTSGLRRLLFLPPGWLNLRFASAASPSGFTGREPLNFRRAIPSPAGPLMHSLFEPNLASPAHAYDEYSIFHRPLHLPESSS